MAFLDPLFEAPTWQKSVLGAIGLLALGGLGYGLGIAGLENRVAMLHDQRENQRQEIARVRALAADVPRLRREAAEMERRLEAAKERLPSEREMPAFYRVLSDAAVQSGLSVILFQPQKPRVRDFYNEIPIALHAEGDYHGVGDFVGRVASLPRTTTIGEFTLTGADPARTGPGAGRSTDSRQREASNGRSRPSLRAEITLLTYVYRPVGSPPAPKPAATAGKPEASKP